MYAIYTDGQMNATEECHYFVLNDGFLLHIGLPISVQSINHLSHCRPMF